MQARASLGVPLILGSAGTCGTDAMVDWMFEITRELAGELEQTLSVALIYSEQSQRSVANALRNDQLQALQPKLAISDQVLESCEHIVALAGVEQIQAALQTNADIVIAGRTTDTAVVCALPLLKGCHAGASWHAAKIAECGALCSTHPTSGVVVVDIDKDPETSGLHGETADASSERPGFTIYPTAKDARCTPHSVSAHMLYENADPFILHEPGGHLNVSDSEYIALNEKQVRVTGSKWVPNKSYTVKLEAARLAGYQCTALALLRDQHYVQHARQWVDRLSNFLHTSLETQQWLSDHEYHIDIRLIGDNATLGELEAKPCMANELGVLVIITASTQELADEIGKFTNPYLLHYPLSDDEALPTFAFPYSPAQTSRGALYEFCLNHVMALTDPMSAFSVATHRLSPEQNS
jgi:hypothetical protein